MRRVVVASVKADWPEEELAIQRGKGWPEGVARVRLTEVDGERVLDIYIMGPEAAAIERALMRETPDRPHTHDLYAKTLDALNARVLQAVITQQRDGTYFAELQLEGAGGQTQLEARPSDAINAALRHDAPIVVADQLLQPPPHVG
jgi:bifunctional DNase/RNase